MQECTEKHVTVLLWGYRKHSCGALWAVLKPLCRVFAIYNCIVLLQQKSICALKRFMLQVVSVLCEPVVSERYRKSTVWSLIKNHSQPATFCRTVSWFAQQLPNSSRESNLSKIRLIGILPAKLVGLCVLYATSSLLLVP